MRSRYRAVVPRFDMPRILARWLISSCVRVQSVDSCSGFRCGCPDSGCARGLRRRRRFALNQSSLLAVIIKYFGVAAPVHGSFELAQHFIFGKMLIENVMKE